MKIHEMIKEQIEDDADREINDFRTNYETLLNNERQLVLKLKGEAGVLKNKYTASQVDLKDLKWELNNLRDDYAQLKTRKEELDEIVSDLKNQVTYKNTIIFGKDETINEFKLTNQELEKIKFVLEHRVNEMSNQIEPRDREIRELKEKINDMETELLALNGINQKLDLKITGLKEKLSSGKQEIQKEIGTRKQNQRLLGKIRLDILNAAALIHEPTALKNAVIKLYNRYSASDNLKLSRQTDMDAQCEFAKQRDHLENSIRLLKKQLDRGNSKNNASYDKLLEDNVFLLSELNALREELRSSQRHISDMEGLLGVKGRDVGPTEARAKICKIVRGNEELKREYKSKLKDCEKIIDLLKSDLRELRNEILEQDYQE